MLRRRDFIKAGALLVPAAALAGNNAGWTNSGGALSTQNKALNVDAVASGSGDNKLLTISGSSDATHVKWDLSATYLGAFRVPPSPGGQGLQTFEFSDGIICYNPDNNSLFISGHDTDDGVIAEINIPTPVNSTNLNALPTATTRQGMVKTLTKGTLLGSPPAGGFKVAGLHYNAGRLMVNVFGMYAQDTSGNHQYLVFRNANALASSVVDGWMTTPYPSAACGSVLPIPASLQAALGGTHITGWSNSTARASYASLSAGPAAFAFNANDVLANSQTIGNGQIAMQRLMKHDLYGVLAPTDNHLYNDNNGAAKGGTILSSNAVWTHMSEISGNIILPGTKTYMCVGGSAMNASGGWYGSDATHDQGHHPNSDSDFRFFYWLIPTDDLAAVKAGTKAYNQVTPYEWGELSIPSVGSPSEPYISGSAWDATNKRLFLSVREADNSQTYYKTPIIHVFDMSAFAA